MRTHILKHTKLREVGNSYQCMNTGATYHVHVDVVRRGRDMFLTIFVNGRDITPETKREWLLTYKDTRVRYGRFQAQSVGQVERAGYRIARNHVCTLADAQSAPRIVVQVETQAVKAA